MSEWRTTISVHALQQRFHWWDPNWTYVDVQRATHEQTNDRD